MSDKNGGSNDLVEDITAGAIGGAALAAVGAMGFAGPLLLAAAVGSVAGGGIGALAGPIIEKRLALRRRAAAMSSPDEGEGDRKGR